jgi:hypothetical protein
VRAVLLALALLVAGSARAEWEKLAEAGDTVFYLDPATIEAKGDLRRVWQLRDWKAPDDRGRRSARILREYDCREPRNRVLAATEFDGPKGTGKRLRSSGFAPAPWEAVAPDTVGALMLARVCAP